ncbi:Palmitoyl-protein thioesterase [Mycena sanguinolenta]|uniref:Palmitoyl-protein thioesterase 1 n=1 Tax=Mycena sanguinolenta TaxID=230812 RepID=A0A8H7DKS1_9AGAR|nr:Palmitoyl-protein thioesterase [Mycena sanguinolenta]
MFKALRYFLTISLFGLVWAQQPRPLVLWHGLGDSANAPGILRFVEEIKSVHPGIFVHSIYLEEDIDKDRQAGFYGNVNEQVQFVSEQLAAIPELEGGFDAIGFSQGGQFLRAYVERYNSPPVNNLITFGSQHMGVSDIPTCGPRDFMCQIARRAVKAGVYSSWAQEHLVTAQYFRDPANLEGYYSSNKFLTSINNEILESRNETYARNLASLNKLVLIMFTEDKTVVPKESSWFGSEVVVDDISLTDDHQRVLADTRIPVSMYEQPLYQEDWIGLRELDERGDVVFGVCESVHMDIEDCWEAFVREYAGGDL